MWCYRMLKRGSTINKVVSGLYRFTTSLELFEILGKLKSPEG